MSERQLIVVADDEAAYARALSVRLQDAGYDVLVAGDGYGALALAAKHEPDLLILDVHMPAGGGFSIQQRKDRMTHLAFIPVIYISGDVSEYTRRQAEHSGAPLLHKPFKFPLLLEEVQRILERPAA